MVSARVPVTFWQKRVYRRHNLALYSNIEALVGIKNCGSQTGKEIWVFMTNPEREVKEVKFEDLIPN